MTPCSIKITDNSKCAVVPFYAKEYYDWCQYLQQQIINALEAIENEYADTNGNQATAFKKKNWDYKQNGGGIMATIENGQVFEKGGVNVSCVWGEFAPEFAHLIPGADLNPNFWACGISLVIHPRNPYVPIVHLNTRHIITTKSWFGGSLDLTPTFPDETDTKYFHDCLKDTCNQFDKSYYERFSKWCDEYFYLPHRKEIRGVGGIFYDYLNNNDFDKDFAFNKSVGLSFLKSYQEIVRRNMYKSFDSKAEAALLHKRSRYVEFNLLYDRGTQFGLKTDGNVDAILMSMPPRASWSIAA